MRGILIDPFTRTVSDVDTNAGLDDLYKLLQVDIITVVNVGANHALILDDEGLLKPKESQEYFLMIGASQPFAGRGLILADEMGENRGATLPLPLVQSKVKFIDKESIDPNDWVKWEISIY